MEYWGKGSITNTIGWGQGSVTNDIGWGSIHYSLTDNTNLAGLSDDGITYKERVELDSGTIEKLTCINKIN